MSAQITPATIAPKSATIATPAKVAKVATPAKGKVAPKPTAKVATPAKGAKSAKGAKGDTKWGQRMSEASNHPTKLEGNAGSFRQFTADNAAKDGWVVKVDGDVTTFTKGAKVLTVTYSAQHYARTAVLKSTAKSAPRPLWEGNTSEKWAKVNRALQS